MEVTGNVVDYTVRMCTTQEKIILGGTRKAKRYVPPAPLCQAACVELQQDDPHQPQGHKTGESMDEGVANNIAYVERVVHGQ